jgi:hypothetical protein
MEYGLEYAYRWFPAEFISVSPYLHLNLNALSSMGAWGEHFGNANTWAGENTLAFNLLLTRDSPQGRCRPPSLI